MNLNSIRKSRLSLKIGVAALLLFAALLVSLRFGPQTLESEISFDTDLHNSLWNLGNAKQQWAQEKQKSERDIPTLTELAPYLGEWKDRIGKLSALGITYKITSMEEPQSDIATLTRDVRFQSGFSRFYGAGTSLCLHRREGSWQGPGFSARALYYQNVVFLETGLLVLAVASLLWFAIGKACSRKEGRKVYAHLLVSRTVLLSLLCFLGIGFFSAMPPYDYLIEKLDNPLALLFLTPSLLPPVFVLRSIWKKRTPCPNRFALLSAFIFSILPGTCILWTIGSAQFSPLAGHVFEQNTKRISLGMNRAQVTQTIGSPEGESWGDRKRRITYDLQRKPWGWSGKQFFVDFIDDKVVSAKIVRYGGDIDDTFFMNDDVAGLLKSGTDASN